MLAAILLAVTVSPDAAYARLGGAARLAPDEARRRVHALVESLEDARLPRGADALLASLANDASPEVRDAARDELAERAQADPAAQALLSRVKLEGKLPPMLALGLARDHLERALQLSPFDPGQSFTGVDEGPALEQASAQSGPQPLDKELASEMGAPAGSPETKQAPAQDEQPRSSAAALRELDAARSLAAQIPKGSDAEAGAHEVAGLAALAENDGDAAVKEFVAVASLPVKRGDAAGEARRDKAYLQLARLAYAMGDDARATELYGRVSRNAPEWLDALFEASWSRFRTTQDELALGNLLTLQAPFFTGRFFPEAAVLKALVFFENCRYPDARKALTEFEQRYALLHQGLTSTLASVPTAQAASEFLNRGPVALQGVEPGARDEVHRIEQSPDVAAEMNAAAQLAREIDSLDQKPFRRSDLVTRLSPAARDARLLLLDDAARKFVARLDGERAQLRELLGQSLRISYEIAGREKELANDPGGGAPAVVHNERQQVEDDEENWPFDGEYWRDELGNYRYQLGRKCKKPRAPPQTATSVTSSPPSHLAADPQ
jgi:hypothetical protein